REPASDVEGIDSLRHSRKGIVTVNPVTNGVVSAVTARGEVEFIASVNLHCRRRAVIVLVGDVAVVGRERRGVRYRGDGLDAAAQVEEPESAYADLRARDQAMAAAGRIRGDSVRPRAIREADVVRSQRCRADGGRAGTACGGQRAAAILRDH